MALENVFSIQQRQFSNVEHLKESIVFQYTSCFKIFPMLKFIMCITINDKVS